MNDEALIRRLAAGSRTALNQAVDRFTPYVSAVAWRVLAPSAATREDLEEVVADVFLALWSHAMDIDPGQVRTWLRAVAKNKAVDRLRTLSPTLPLCENAADRSPGPEEETLLRERAARLLAAVEALEEPIPEDLGVDEQTGCNIPARNAMSMGVREIKQAATQTSRTWQLDVSLDSNEAANYLHARLCYMNRACTIALPLSPAESVTLDIGASGPGSPTSENTQGGTITLESVTLSPFTCQIAARHEDGNKEVDPLIFFLLEDGTLRTSGQLLFHSKTSYHSDGTADYSYQFQEVLDLSQLSAVVFDGTAYPLDGGAAYGVEVDPRLYPFQLPLMDRLSEDSGLALPLEALYEALGASYTWDGEAQTAVCSYRGVTLELTVGSRTALVNGVPVALEDAPALQNGILAVGNDISDFLGLNTFVVYNTEEDGFLDYLCWIVIP